MRPTSNLVEETHDFGGSQNFAFEGRSVSLKRRREEENGKSSHLSRPPVMVSKSCTPDGKLDAPCDLREILGAMLQDRQLQELCDVVIVVGGERFPAHKAVLAAASRVFKAMFTRDMKEKNANEIVLSSLDPKSWRIAVQYIYTAQVDIEDEETALLVLESARMYQLETLENFVEQFLISRLSVTNCFQLLEHAEHYDLLELKMACLRNMEDKFEDLVKSAALPHCPPDLLLNLLQSGNLVIKSEMTVFEAVARWVEADEQTRICELEKMLQTVRISEMSDCELACVGKNPIATRSLKFRLALLELLLHRRGENTTLSRLLVTGSHLKARKRQDRPFTFVHILRGLNGNCNGDDEEVVRTSWNTDCTGRHLWRLKIYPRGYLKAKGEYLSMYVQGRSASKNEELDLMAKFDIFLINRKDSAATISFSSQHHFTTSSDHWGFHRYIPLSRLTDPKDGFISDDNDSVVLGANVIF